MKSTTIKELIEQNGVRFAEKPALMRKLGNDWVPITYKEMCHRIRDLGTSLVRMGMKKGDRIALLTPNCPEWAISHLAITTHNGIVVPIDKELKAQELLHILEDSGAKSIIITSEYLGKIEEIYDLLPNLEIIILISDPQSEVAMPEKLKNEIKKIEKAWEDLVKKIKKEHQSEIENIEKLWNKFEEDLKTLKIKKNNHVIDRQNLILNFTRGLSTVTEKIPEIVYFDDLFGNEKFVETTMDYQDVIAILYTSGTTGKTKGVMLTNENIIANYLGVVELMRVDDTIRVLSVLPINHVYESTCGILMPLCLGGTVSFAESLLKVAQNLKETQPNFFLGVPALYQALYTRMSQKINSSIAGRIMNSNPLTRKVIQKKIKGELGGSDISFISGGASLDPSIESGLRKLGFKIYNGYGITETAPLVAVNSVVGGDRAGSVGKVMPGVLVRINNPGEGDVGEIWIKGPNVMKGYYNNPRATAEIITDGWYHSGDLGYLDKDNFLFVKGRMKNLIVTGKGKNIYPEEVEGELERSPFIQETMVYAHKPGTTDEEVRAVIYLNQEALDNYAKENNIKELTIKQIHDIAREEIKNYCSNLADYKRVKEFIIRDEEFPKTSTRKIKRYAMDEVISVNHR